MQSGCCFATRSGIVRPSFCGNETMHSFALKKTAFAVLIALGAGVALAADNLTVEKGQTQTDDVEKTYGH